MLDALRQPLEAGEGLRGREQGRVGWVDEVGELDDAGRTGGVGHVRASPLLRALVVAGAW